MLRVLCNEPTSFYHSCCIGVSADVFSRLNYHVMCPHSPVFLLDCYCSSCNRNRRIFSSIFTHIIWWASDASWCRSSLSTLMGSLLIWHNRSVISLLNSIIAKLRRPAPISIEHVCNNKVKCMPLLMSRHINGTHNKFYAHFHLPW